MGTSIAGQLPDEALDMDALIEKYIFVPPFGDPGAARVVGPGVSVWALIAYYEAVDHDTNQVAHDYRLCRDAVDAAVAYYRRHQPLIDALIESHRSIVA